MRDHLQRSHAAVYAHDSEQPKIDSLIKVKKCSPARARMIVGMTVHDYDQHEWLKDLMEYCEPGYTVPLRKHISKLMFD